MLSQCCKETFHGEKTLIVFFLVFIPKVTSEKKDDMFLERRERENRSRNLPLKVCALPSPQMMNFSLFQGDNRGD